MMFRGKQISSVTSLIQSSAQNSAASLRILDKKSLCVKADGEIINSWSSAWSG